MNIRRTILLLASFCFVGAGATTAPAQLMSDSSLTGTYYVTLLEITSAGENVSDVATLGGSILFDGAGGYTFAGEGAAGGDAFAPAAGVGSYSLTSSGMMTLSHPTAADTIIHAMVSADGSILLGSDTESTDQTQSMLVAVQASTDLSNASVSGTYTGSVLSFPAANRSAFSSSLLTLNADGAGGLGSVAISGRTIFANAQSDTAPDSTYTMTADGSGNAFFGGDSAFVNGFHQLYASPGGDYLIGYSTGPDRSLLVAARDHAGAAETLSGRYWIAETLFDGAQFTTATGSILPDGPALALITERLRFGSGAIDFTGINFYATAEDGSGWLSGAPLEDAVNMHLGVTEDGGTAGAAVGAQVAGGAQLGGLFLIVRAPDYEAPEPFLNPVGVVNGGSFSPFPNPVTPGAIVSLFGNGFLANGASNTVADALPLPDTLGGVNVNVNGAPAPFFFASDGQLNVQFPYDIEGESVTVEVESESGTSNEVVVPLSPVNPGVISDIQPQSFYAALAFHNDGERVTTQRPAQAGESIVIYVTGLGDLSPAVAAGAANPGLGGEPLPVATAEVQVFFNLVQGTTIYAGGTPGFAGLTQINVTVPDGIVGGNAIALAVAAPGAFHDQTDLPIARRTVAAAEAEGATKGSLISEGFIPYRAR